MGRATVAKPIVFFSHSSHDSASLTLLRKAFAEKTGNSVDIFLSSDGQSIPFGHNWVKKIEEALEGAALMIVFVSPASVRSSWLYFESGHAYSKGVRVVPVGFLGLDLANLHPPLALLQGFNIGSEEGLNNLISLANEEFGHAHPLTFSQSDYDSICVSASGMAKETLGRHGSEVDEIEIWLNEGLQMKPKEALAELKSILERASIDYEMSEDWRLDAFGLSARARSNPEDVVIVVDPALADLNLGPINRFADVVCKDGIRDARAFLRFLPPVRFLPSRSKITARLYRSGVRLAPDNKLVWKGLRFELRNDVDRDGDPRPGSMRLSVDEGEIGQGNLRELLDLLFSLNVAYYDDQVF